MPTILIIDDCVQYRADLAQLLEFEKYHTMEAENGLAGLEIIRYVLPDLIICDVDMPVMNGIEVLKTVKADPIYSKIPFVMATGHSDAPTIQAIVDLDVDNYLIKPITISQLLMTIGRFLWNKCA